MPEQVKYLYKYFLDKKTKLYYFVSKFLKHFRVKESSLDKAIRMHERREMQRQINGRYYEHTHLKR
jgi:hypothetical protein